MGSNVHFPSSYKGLVDGEGPRFPGMDQSIVHAMGKELLFPPTFSLDMDKSVYLYGCRHRQRCRCACVVVKWWCDFRSAEIKACSIRSLGVNNPLLVNIPFRALTEFHS